MPKTGSSPFGSTFDLQARTVAIMPGVDLGAMHTALAEVTALGESCGAVAVITGGGVYCAGSVDHAVPVASVSKALFGYAVMVAVEEEVLFLDQPCGLLGSTVRHLLAHAGGYGFAGSDPVTAPGTRRIYSNHGFDVLGQLLEQEAQMSAGDYLHQAVFAPLAMDASSLGGSPAKDVVSTAHDLAQFVAELLRPTLIHPTTFSSFHAVQFPDLAGMVPGVGRFRPNPWGLGVEIRGAKSPHWTGLQNSVDTFGHFGGLGSFLWVDPERRVGLTVTNHRTFGPWALLSWPRISDAVLEVLG